MAQIALQGIAWTSHVHNLQKRYGQLLFYKFIEYHEGKYPLIFRNITPKILIGPEEGYSDVIVITLKLFRFFYLKLYDSTDKEFAIIRSNEYQQLSTIKTAIEDAKKNLANIGRPLTV